MIIKLDLNTPPPTETLLRKRDYRFSVRNIVILNSRK